MSDVLTTPYLLIAMPQLHDQNFKNSVILVIEHGEDGAMGFVVNRPEPVPLASVIEIPGTTVPEAVPIWYGGPVEQDVGILLHAHDEHVAPATGESSEIAEGVFLSSSVGTIADMVRLYGTEPGIPLTSPTPRSHLYPFRFLVGYAGWNPGQLDQEVRSGSWVQVPLESSLLFDTPWNSLWDRAMVNFGVDPSRIIFQTPQYLN